MFIYIYMHNPNDAQMYIYVWPARVFIRRGLWPLGVWRQSPSSKPSKPPKPLVKIAVTV